ncbi:MAG TPA: hypothetical protein VLB44_06730 [Kofleriaceae bacterium]|nr:hypothetical protein [Kofleriaceae bacterium]
MRFLLGLAVALSLVACGAKKKSPQSPASPAPAAKDEAGDDDEKNAATPDDQDDAKPIDKSDPQEGGE